MQDEIVKTTEICISPKAFDEVPSENVAFVVDNVDGDEDQGWLAEDGNRFVYETLSNEQTKASMVVRAEIDLPYGTGKSSSFSYRAEGNINATMGEEFELLAEDGRKFTEESTGELMELSSEAGESYLLEQSYLSNDRFVINLAADTDPAQVRRFISEAYDELPSITGTNTFFNTDFNAPIVLEDDDLTLVAEGGAIDGNRILTERDKPFGAEHDDNATSYVTLESHTDDQDLILSESDVDRVFLPLQLEDDTGNLALEVQEYTSDRRLLYNDLLDLIIEDEGVSLEEDDRILMEDYCGGPADQFIAEDGSYFKLNHNSDNLGTEGVLGLQHLTQEEMRIEDFHGKVGLEGGQGDIGSVILESSTPSGIGITFLTEHGDRLLHDHVDSNPIFLLDENSYARTSSDGVVKALDDNRLLGYQTDNFIAENSVNLVAEDGNNFTAESTRAHATTSEVELVNQKWPHGVTDNARIIFADGDSATVIEKVDDYRINVDLGVILLEDAENPITQSQYLLILEADGGRMLFNYGNSTSQTYRLEYGRYTQDSQEGKLLVEDTTEANDIGRAYQFTIDGIKTTRGDAPNLHEWSEIHGDNIVFESGENILMEDGEILSLIHI